MAYERQYYTNGDVLDARQLNHMETGIKENSDNIGKLSEDIADLKENGTGGGATTAQANSLWAIIQKSAFAQQLTDAEINEFKISWGIGGEVEPDIPDEPIEPDNPEVTLTSISATYTGGDVTVGTALSDLTGIRVTAHYSDGSTSNVTGYTLSGEILEGENTITVSYGGKTTTFTVTGVVESGGESTAVNLMTTGDLGIFSDLGVYTGYTGYYNADAKTLQLTPRSESTSKNAHLKITPFVETGKSYTLFIGYDNRNTTLSSASVKYSATTEHTNAAIPVYKQGTVGNVTGEIEYIQFTVPDDAQTLNILYQTTERKETTVVNVALYEGTYTEMP